MPNVKVIFEYLADDPIRPVSKRRGANGTAYLTGKKSFA